MATYGGDGTYSASTSVIYLEVVNPATTTTGVTTSNASVGYSTAVTFTATVSTTSALTPTGSVSFYDNDVLHDDPGEPASAFGAGSNNGPYASHGCIHVPHDAMAFLYGWLPVGATVRGVTPRVVLVSGRLETVTVMGLVPAVEPR